MNFSRLTPLLVATLVTPLGAQEPASSATPWIFSVTAGTAFGGPSRVMGDHLVAEGWTETGCSTKGTDCHSNPVVNRPRLQFAARVGREFGSRLEAEAIVAGAGLGSAEGRLANTDVRATWRAGSLATAVIVKPLPFLRLGAGPLLALLQGATPPYAPTLVWRAGYLLESGFRANVGSPLFLDLSLAYRHMGKRHEGPWPTRKYASIGDGGPSPLSLDYSHLSLGLGVGAHF